MSTINSLFEQQMASFNIPRGKKIAIAVSGGADSLCLTFLLHTFAQKQGYFLTALTVDHRIRPESAAEAQSVHQLLTQKHIRHVILTNKIPFQETRLEEKARKIRYDLLCHYCLKNEIEYLFLAHHQSDQAETFLSRLARGSGIEGLSAIKPIIKYQGIHILRPLLNTPKEKLTDFLIQAGIEWIEDPMNQNIAFERIKWRRFLPFLTQNGLSLSALTLSINRLNSAREALAFYTDTFIQKHVHVSPLGFIKIDNDAFYALPNEIKIRVLTESITQIGQSGKPLSLDSLEKLIKRMPTKATLGECVIIAHKKGLFIGKESHKQESEKFIPAYMPTRWDRFMIKTPTPLFVRSQAPNRRLPDIPAIIQKSFPFIVFQKELEKNVDIDYKEWNTHQINIQFIQN